jgi:iron complex transport system permease protein
MLHRHRQHDAALVRHWLLPVLGTLLVAVVLLAVAIGSVAIPLSQVSGILARWLVGAPLDAYPANLVSILTVIRLPRILLVACTGAALSASGAAYQGLFRNSLADPYVIGVAAGAGFGAMLAVFIGAPVWLGISAVPIGAFLGALAVVSAVSMFAQRSQHRTSDALILAGIAIGMVASAATTFLMLRAGEQSSRLLGFLLGSASSVGWGAVAFVGAGLGIGMVLLGVVARDLNAMVVSEEQATLMGINVRLVRRLVIVGATVMTATAVAFHGLIGFVGIIVPHALRLVSGGDHRRLIPAAALSGAVFLVGCDIAARTLTAPQELPLGIITACIGSPAFLVLLFRKSSR